MSLQPANSFQNIYGEELGAPYMEEDGRRRNLQKRRQKTTRLSYEDISQFHLNSFQLNNETLIGSDNNYGKRNTDSDSGEDDASFENGLPMSVPYSQKISAGVTPR